MAPRRRSSRLNRGATPNRSNAMPSPTKLSSLVEREESPPSGSQVHIDAIRSSSMTPTNTAILRCDSPIKSSSTKTPQPIAGNHPSHEEMHPSKAQHSSVKFGTMDSQSRLLDHEGSRTVPKPRYSSAAVVQSTPTKMRGSMPALLSSPNFNFTFSPTDATLSVEAQKIMDSVRGEAAKIKAQMQAERDQQEHKEEEANHLYGVGGRTIAKPRGKAGRYSDVHMQEFKKMDSIAGHASTWKNKPQPNEASLKRSNSKARLKAEEPKTKVDRSIRSNNDDRLENTAPGKRAKKNYRDDASSARPPSRDEASEGECSQPDSSQTWAQTGLPSAVTTPTKASLARSASVKQVKTSMIPSLSRSQSTKTIRHAVTPKLDGGNKRLTSLSRFGNMKSILHRRQPKFSDDPAKVAAGTHIPAPEVGVTLEKDLPPLASLPSTPHPGRRTPANAIVKHVDFTPGTKLNFDFAAASPSPSKIPLPQLHQPTGLFTSGPSLYPSLANSPNITTRTPKIPTPSAPIEFSFRANQTLPLERSPLAAKTPTIRQVRPSGIATPMTALENLPPIPHGISNKKRRRVDSDDEDMENVPPANGTEENGDGPRTKKLKFSPQKEAPTGAKKKTPKLGGTTIPKPASARPGVLSLSRLHMLSRPKNKR